MERGAPIYRLLIPSKSGYNWNRKTSAPTYNGTIRGAPGYIETGRHICASYGFDLFYCPEGRMGQQLVKVTDDFIE